MSPVMLTDLIMVGSALVSIIYNTLQLVFSLFQVSSGCYLFRLLTFCFEIEDHTNHIELYKHKNVLVKVKSARSSVIRMGITCIAIL